MSEEVETLRDRLSRAVEHQEQKDSDSEKLREAMDEQKKSWDTENQRLSEEHRNELNECRGKLTEQINALNKEVSELNVKLSDSDDKKSFFETERNKLKVCFDTLNQEREQKVSALELAQQSVTKFEDDLEISNKRCNQLQDQLNNEKENGVCHKAEITELNIALDDAKKSSDKEKRKIKKLLHEQEKKEISISELENEMRAKSELVEQKDGELRQANNSIASLEKSVELEKEKSSSQRKKLDDIKARLMTSRQGKTNEDDDDELDIDKYDFNSHILQLQEKVALMESEKRKEIEEKVEEERLQIVESTKAFVMERERANEECTKDLREELGLKKKRIESLSKKLEHVEEECKEKEYALQQERISCEKLVSAAEEKASSQRRAKRDSSAASIGPNSGDEISELHERLENARTQNAELRNDFAKMVDDYDKARQKETRELTKTKTQLDKLKTQFEKKDVELKKHLSSGKDQTKNVKSIDDLRAKLVASDEKLVEMQLQKDDLENTMSTKSAQHTKEMANLNKRLTSLLGDNEQLRKKVAELNDSLNASTKENLRLKHDRAAYPFAATRGTGVSPLTHSMSSLKVLSTEEESTDTETPASGVASSSSKTRHLSTNSVFKQNETPKRSSDLTTEHVPSKSKRLRVNSIAEEKTASPLDDVTKSSVLSTTTAAATSLSGPTSRRRSTRLANNKPYRREIIVTSSSDDEPRTKTTEGTEITTTATTIIPPQTDTTNKENPVGDPIAQRALRKQNSGPPLSPRKNNIQETSRLLKKPELTMNTVPENEGSKRLTRSRSGKVQQRHDNETKQTENEATTSKLAMRKPIRSHSGQDDEKCNMQ